MALSGSFSGSCSGSNGAKYSTWIEWVVNGQSIANDLSNVTVNFKLQRNDGWAGSAYNLNASNNVQIYVNGGLVYNVNRAIDTRNNVVVLLGSWTGDVGHDVNGVLNLPISASFVINGISDFSGGSVSGTAPINTIDRYPTTPTSCVISQDGDTNNYTRGVVNISWSGTTGPVTNYNLFRATTGPNDNSYSDWVYIGSVSTSAGNGSITDTTPSSYMAGVKVKYAVIAYNGSLGSSLRESNSLVVNGAIKLNNGNWSNATVWININGTWVRAKAVWININGTWKRSV